MTADSLGPSQYELADSTRSLVAHAIETLSRAYRLPGVKGDIVNIGEQQLMEISGLLRASQRIVSERVPGWLASLEILIGVLSPTLGQSFDGKAIEEIVGSISKWSKLHKFVEGPEPENMDDRLRVSEVRNAISMLHFLDSQLAALKRLDGAADSAERSAEAVSQVAGETAKRALSHHFKVMARWQRAAYVGWVLLLSAALALSLYIALKVAFDSDVQPTSKYIGKLAAAIPLVIFAGFAARAALQHQRASTWASVRRVQLDSLNAYLDPLSVETSDSIHRDFGASLFGGVDYLSDQSPGHQATASPQLTLSDFASLQKIIEGISKKP